MFLKEKKKLLGSFFLGGKLGFWIEYNLHRVRVKVVLNVGKVKETRVKKSLLTRKIYAESTN